MNKEFFINSFQVVLPQKRLPQNEIVDWILKAHEKSGTLEKDLHRYALNEKYIKQRYFECNELDELWNEHEIYRISPASPEGAQIEKRNEYFFRKSKDVFDKLYQDTIPEHVIHVTCTGYVSPSPVQATFSNRAHSPDITHAYHMGCYASLPAVRMAKALSQSEERNIDVVHTEICSLHLNAAIHTAEQIVVQSLFADGHIKYSINQNPTGFKILTIQEKLISESLNDMTWVPSAHGMAMTLSKEVPFKLRDALPGFIDELCQKAGQSKEKILKEGIFAIHPGGPKIIKAVQKKLELRDDQVSTSQKVLLERGNMSSATLPHVWNEILNDKPASGTKVLSLAFGPGLTIFGSIFEVVA